MRPKHDGHHKARSGSIAVISAPCTTLSPMPVSITRLRRWFAGAAILVCLVVAAVYFYARHRMTNALKQVPNKIGLEIQQSAQGFTISKSDHGRTLFKLQ